MVCAESRAFLIAALAVAVACGGSAFAHDFWIEPSSFRPAPGEEVAIALDVGEHLQGDPVPRATERIDRFVLVGPGGEMELSGEEGKDPAGRVRIGETGIYVAGYRSRRARIELEAAKFESYLAEEGLDAVRELRKKRGESARPGREVYSRCAKSILSAGDAASATGWERVLGFSLEIVPEANPYALVPPPNLPVRILYEGKPLEGILVEALNENDPRHPSSARTGADGRAVLPLGSGGMWLIKAVHMTEAPAGVGADWESLWASLTFEIARSPRSR
jgi:uncharacterized GH25 family protein